ncbi:MAG: PAS domain S-box protein [Haloquadratum sp.]
MSAATDPLTVLLRGASETTTQAVRTAMADCARPVRIVTTSAVADGRERDEGETIDCVVDASGADPGPAGDAATGREVPAVLYPSTPDPELARLSTDRATVRYLPQSIDTDDRRLLVDAVEDLVEKRRRRASERRHRSVWELLSRIDRVLGDTLRRLPASDLDDALATVTELLISDWEYCVARIDECDSAGEPLVERAVTTKQLATDVVAPAETDGDAGGTDAVGETSAAAVPVIVDDDVRAVLVVHRPDADGFGEYERSFLNHLGAKLSDAFALQRHERELEEKRDLLAQTSALARVGGWELDAERDELRWTEETYRIHGVSESFEPTLEAAIDFYHPDDRADVRADVERALAGESFDATYRLRRADGERRWVRSRGDPIVEDGEVVGLCGAVQDVTDRKRSEDATRRFKRAVEAAGHAIFITERDGTIRYVNPAFEEITGYDAEEAVGRDPSILKSGEMDAEYYTRLWNTILDGDVWSEPIVNQQKSGEHYHASETIAPIVDDGEIEGFVAIQTEITDRVHTKERLETFREIVQRLDDPIMLQDREGRFQVVNDAVAEYAGLPREALIGADESEFMDDATARTIREKKRRVVEAERAITYEVTPTFPRKGQRSFVTTRYPHYDEEGDVDGTVAICRDVTEQAEREHQLRVLDRVLRHNLNNKMNLILGHAELLEGETSGRAAQSARKIRDAGENLVELAAKERRIVDLLTDEAEPRRRDACAVVEDAVADVRAEYPEHRVVVDCPEAVEVRAVSEVRDAIVELIGNAFVHGDADTEVVVSVAPDGDDRIGIAVADTGPGIPEMERQAARGATDITPLFHGSGLGLQFVYHVANRSGGSVRFRSPGDEGAVPPLEGAIESAIEDVSGRIGTVVILSLPRAAASTGDGGTAGEQNAPVGEESD